MLKSSYSLIFRRREVDIPFTNPETRHWQLSMTNCSHIGPDTLTAQHIGRFQRNERPINLSMFFSLFERAIAVIYIFYRNEKRRINCTDVPSNGSYILPRIYVAGQVLWSLWLVHHLTVAPSTRHHWRTSLKDDRELIKAVINLRRTKVLYICTWFLCSEPIISNQIHWKHQVQRL